MAKAKIIKAQDYICLSAMLRAREAKLLGREQFERMLTEGFAEVCRAAADAGYADMSDMDAAGINAALAARYAAELEDVREMLPDKALMRLLCLQYDCHNAKVLVKSGGAAEGALYSANGCYTVAELKEAYDSEAGDGDLPPELAEAIRAARAALARTGNPQLSDFLLDKAYFTLMLAQAEATGSAFYVGYVRNRIDKVNLRSLLRTLDMGRRGDLLANALVEGGSVGLDLIRDPALTREDIVKLYAPTPFDRAAEEAGMTAFEKAADNAELDYVASCGLIPFGPEVVLEYFTALENEVMSLRIILTGKRMGVGADTLRERLRENYV